MIWRPALALLLTFTLCPPSQGKTPREAIHLRDSSRLATLEAQDQRDRQANPCGDDGRHDQQRSGDDIERHASIVEQLQKQGMYRWAEKEYRRIIAIGPPGSAPAAIFLAIAAPSRRPMSPKSRVSRA